MDIVEKSIQQLQKSLERIANPNETSATDDGITTITVDDTIIKACFQKIGSIAKSYQQYLR